MKSGCDRCGRSKRERGIAQLAEHRSPKPKVGGSIPSAPAPEHFSVVFSVSLRACSFGSLTELLKNDPIYGESFLFRGSPYNRRQSNACIGGAPCSAWNLWLLYAELSRRVNAHSLACRRIDRRGRGRAIFARWYRIYRFYQGFLA